MDYDLIPLLADLLMKACGFWIVMITVIITFLCLLLPFLRRIPFPSAGDSE